MISLFIKHPFDIGTFIPLPSFSLQPVCASDKTVPVWGVSVTGEVVVRLGVTAECHQGESWTLVPAECPMMSVCAGVAPSSVWAVSKDGRAHLRLGVTPDIPQVCKGRERARGREMIVYLFIYEYKFAFS